MDAARRIAVVGGGIAGVAAAERLARRGHAVELFEAGERLGGRIAPDRLREREVALGGKNVGRAYTELRALLARHGEDRFEYFGPDAAQVVRGRVRQLSFRSPRVRARLFGRMLARFELGGGYRFLKLAKQVRSHERSRFLGDPFFAELAQRTGDPALTDYVGRAMSDVLRFITVRMNGAEPDEAHVGNFGSNLALVVDKFDQLEGPGFAPLLRRIENTHRVHLRARVDELVLRDGRVTGVLVGGEQRDDFDGVVLALPATHAAALAEPVDSQLAALLRTIRYFPVGVVVAEYDRAVFPPEYAALAAPAGMALSNAGSYGLAERNLIRFTFSGRAARERLAPDAFDPEALLADAEEFLARHLPPTGASRVGYVARRFDPGLCAYRRDHAGFLGALDARLRSCEGLALAGDYLRGASLEACVRAGQEAADQIELTPLPERSAA
ncbi:MAG: FAD-dependent oxidoreductase [Thermoleophilaceae bacterium]